MPTDKRLALNTLCSNDKGLRNRLFFSNACKPCTTKVFWPLKS